MRWLETEGAQKIWPAAEIDLLRRAIAMQPEAAFAHESLGRAFFLCRDFRHAADAYDSALRLEREAFRSWAPLAKSWLELGHPETALEICNEGIARRPDAELGYMRGRALQILGRVMEARRDFLAVLEMGDRELAALAALLTPLAKKADGKELLDFCDGLSQTYCDTALVRAHRAIGLSRSGRKDEARVLVDVHRHVMRLPFEPPPDMGDVSEFNAALAEEILGDPLPDPTARDGTDITYLPRAHRRPAMLALQAFFRRAFETYISNIAALGLQGILPPPPSAGSLYSASVVLRRDGRNGEHVHGRGYVSGVYHVVLPDCVSRAHDARGALALGCCREYTDGHEGCWGVRHVRPVAGWLVMFPSHIFHDVVPSGTEEPRISVAADLRPVMPAG